MAKHRNRRKRGAGFVAVPVTAELGLSTLGDNTVLTQSILGALGEEMFFISADLTWTLAEATAGEGPIKVGVAHGDLTAAEINEALDASPLDRDDIIANERRRRPVRTVGMFRSTTATEVLNDGRKIRTTIKMKVGIGHDLNFWARNQSGATLTAGTQIQVDGVLYARWI